MDAFPVSPSFIIFFTQAMDLFFYLCFLVVFLREDKNATASSNFKKPLSIAQHQTVGLRINDASHSIFMGE